MDERTATWTGVLAQWTAFAQSAVALPAGGAGERWRRSVPHAITLHAVALALRDLLAIPLDDRPLARDRAAVLVRDANAALDAAWRGASMPEGLSLLRHDAAVALDDTAWAGAVELTWPGPGAATVPALVDPDGLDAVGTLCVAAPGTVVMPGTPVAWWVGRAGVECPGCARHEVLTPRQTYRVLDEAGRAVRDVVAPMSDDLPAGMPLLVPLLERGVRVGRFLRDAASWEAMQRAALPSDGVLPVEHRGDQAKSMP